MGPHVAAQDYSYYKHTVQEANNQVGGNLGGPVYSIKSDMPREYQWNLTVQRQLTPNMIAEAAYAGNHSGTLLVQDDLNPFSKSYLQPNLASVLATKIANPISGQLMANDTSYTGPRSRSELCPLNSNPSRGYLSVEGLNLGSRCTTPSTSGWNGGCPRTCVPRQHAVAARPSTTSADPTRVSGRRLAHERPSKHRHLPQRVRLQPDRRTHRLVWYHDVELPFGKGRMFMGHPATSGAKVLDYVLGGWEVAGNAIYNSGTPINFGSTGGVSSQDQGVPGLSGFVLGSTESIKSSAFGNSGGLLRSPGDSYSSCGGTT